MAEVELKCRTCGCIMLLRDDAPKPEICAVCKKLGPRSLVWFLRTWRACTTDEERGIVRQLFDEAKGRSTI